MGQQWLTLGSKTQALAVDSDCQVNQLPSVEGLLQALMSFFGWCPVVLRGRRGACQQLQGELNTDSSQGRMLIFKLITAGAWMSHSRRQ